VFCIIQTDYLTPLLPQTLQGPEPLYAPSIPIIYMPNKMICVVLPLSSWSLQHLSFYHVFPPKYSVLHTSTFCSSTIKPSSGRTMAVGPTQPLTEMSTRNISLGDKGSQCIVLITLLPYCCLLRGGVHAKPGAYLNSKHLCLFFA
jgi:hypothetical protein